MTTVADRVLRVIGAGPARVAQVYRALCDVPAGQVDCAVHGLIAAGRLRRAGDALHRPAHRLTLRCRQCGERRWHDEMVRGDICLRCASDAAAARPAITERTCPTCERTLSVADYGHGTYCRPCQARKQAEYREAYRVRKAAEYAARADRYRADGKTARGVVRAGIRFGRDA
jgi:hypothetical protein